MIITSNKEKVRTLLRSNSFKSIAAFDEIQKLRKTEKKEKKRININMISWHYFGKINLRLSEKTFFYFFNLEPTPKSLFLLQKHKITLITILLCFIILWVLVSSSFSGIFYYKFFRSGFNLNS